MALFKPAEITSAYLKSGAMGFMGSGKSLTLSLLAIGVILYMRKKGIEGAERPAFFLDTETGSDWTAPLFKEMGIDLHVAKTRAFTDLVDGIDEAQKEASFLIADSVTHFWTELTSSYARAKAKQLRIQNGTYRLQFQDWGFLKGDQGWQRFTDRYVNSPLHMAVAGRAGFEYDYFEDDEGKKNLEKTGVKMKAEGEFGFEPSLLFQMETKQRIEGKAVAKVWREAHILKDRSMLIDGKTFFFTGEDDDGKKLSTEELVMQVWRAFQPHIMRLNLGGKQLGVDTQRTSEHAISADRKDWTSTHRTIVLEEIEALLAEKYPSTKVEDKQAKAAAILKHFGSRSWTEVSIMKVEELRLGFDALHRELKDGESSRYAVAPAAPQRTEENPNADMGDDGLPDDFAPPVKDAAAATTAPADGTSQPIDNGVSNEFVNMDIEEVFVRLDVCETIQQVLTWGLKAAQRSDDTATKMRMQAAMLTKQASLLNVAEDAKRDETAANRQAAKRARDRAAREAATTAQKPTEEVSMGG